jgi:hypothetical protein
MQDIFNPSPSDSPAIAQERLVNVLLNNQDGIFSDEGFLEADRQRDDFLTIREIAWFDAMQTHPPLWFALPEDLKVSDKFRLSDLVPDKVDIENWCEQVTQKPWVLLNQKGVPKSIRLHPRILDAYREGWLPYLKKHPWKIWVPKGNRVYMSYALLADHKTIAALTEGWRKREKEIVKCWFNNPSERMRDIPAMQVAVLQVVNDLLKMGQYYHILVSGYTASGQVPSVYLTQLLKKEPFYDTVKIYKDIKHRWKNPGQDWIDRHVSDEVRALLES